MRVFSFVPSSSLKKAYNGLILKYQKYDSAIEFLKVGVLVSVFLLAGFIYLYYVNLSSTRWYFLRQENQKLNTISFNFEILKTKLLDHRQENRSTIQGNSSKRQIVNVNAEVVTIPGNTDLVYRK